jgi:hypothetical protein
MPMIGVIMESDRSPNAVFRRVGVHLASKSHAHKSFVFSKRCL